MQLYQHMMTDVISAGGAANHLPLSGGGKLAAPQLAIPTVIAR
jgi:hypothetical protein